MSHNRFLALLYLRNFLIIFGAFCAFYLFIDILINHKNLTINSNIFLLYVIFTIITAAFFVLPACVMLAMFIARAQLINRNEYIALRSLGLSERRISAPFIAVALIICALFCALSWGKTAYFAEYKDNILKTGVLIQKSSNVLIAAKDKLIFAKTIKENKLEDVLIIYPENSKLKKLISARFAEYIKDDLWRLEDVKIKDFSTLNDQEKQQNISDLNYLILESGLNSQMINQLKDELNSANFINYSNLSIEQNQSQLQSMQLDLGIKKLAFKHQKSEDLSLKDAINLFGVLKDSSILRTSIYKFSVFLFFAPFLGAALLRLLPTHVRFSELSMQLVLVIFICLIVFGCLNLAMRFAQNGAISPELGILLPNVAVIIISLYFCLKD